MTKHISVADGKSVPIEGEGFFCDEKAQFVPNFPTGLIPSSVISARFIAVINANGMHIIPRFDSNIRCVDNLLGNNMKKDTLVTINQVNGLFHVTVKQLRAICTAPILHILKRNWTQSVR